MAPTINTDAVKKASADARKPGVALARKEKWIAAKEHKVEAAAMKIKAVEEGAEEAMKTKMVEEDDLIPQGVDIEAANKESVEVLAKVPNLARFEVSLPDGRPTYQGLFNIPRESVSSVNLPADATRLRWVYSAYSGPKRTANGSQNPQTRMRRFKERKMLPREENTKGLGRRFRARK